jgi:hypothetical protein
VGGLSDLCLAGAFATKTSTIMRVSRATVSKVMSAYTNHGKTTSVKRNSVQKSTLTERDCRTLRRIVSKSHRAAAAQMSAELNILLEDLFPQKLSDMSFTNLISTARLQLLNFDY